MNILSQTYDTPYQLKLPLELSTIIETDDSVYTFCEVISHIDLNAYSGVVEHLGRSELNTFVAQNCHENQGYYRQNQYYR